MKCTIPEISWHNRDPVLSVDIQPKSSNDKNDFYRLASGGTDSHVLIWYMTIKDSGSINLDLAADLTRHQRAVNTVKWSPNGELLASGDDESVIFIWKQKGESEILNIVDTTNEQDKETWITLKILRGHMEDVYDLSWSPNSQFLASGSVDNTAMVWDISKGKSISIFNDHKGFVQGVAWDPQNQYLATLSTDRYMRVFDLQTKKVVSRISKCTLPVPAENKLHNKSVRLFHDDTLQTFFRRLCFSPDGKLLFAPAGITDFDGVTEPLHTTYIFSRYSLKQPAMVLPSPDQYTVAVECCPLLFTLRSHNDTSPPVIPLPYRMIFAVATKTSVYLYDTQQTMPFGMISNIHYTRLTDLTWSNDAKVLVVSSTDGFCSLITFADGELGEVYKKTIDEKKEIDKENIKENTESKKRIEQSNDEKPAPTRIEIRRNPRSPSTDARIETTPLTDIVVAKKIISSNEKFESPEKKNRPVTPISIRRQPRSLSTSASESPHVDTGDNETPKNHDTQSTTPLSSLKVQTPKSKSAKKATTIAIRKQPRNLIPNPIENSILVEEAIDAWPLGQSPPKPTTISHAETATVEKISLAVETTTTGEYTEDMRLVYEESQDEGNLNVVEANTTVVVEEKKDETECKTPRRVPLKTISTPKSKKKQQD